MRWQLFLLYRMVRESLDKKMSESMVQRDGNAAPSEEERVETEEESHLDGG